MKLIPIAILISALTGCASNHTFTPAPQSYRPQGTEKTIQITAKLDQNLSFTEDLTSHLTVYFDDTPQIEGNLDNQVNGDINGKQFQNKNTSASCSTKTISKRIAETRCIIFIDNERVTTLTM